MLRKLILIDSFGGFASKYIKGKFFMDVHPPLAKLLITLAGWLAGFNGDFDFKDIGKDYLEPGVPYVAMRLLPALMGVMTIPTMFLTLKAAGCRTSTAAMGAGLIVFGMAALISNAVTTDNCSENGLLTQSRLILLDSPLVIFTAFTALSWICFTNVHEQGPSRAFDPSWWFWLTATGIGLGATVSVKWVGLFTIAWVGSLTLVQLWVLLGDTRTVTPVSALLSSISALCLHIFSAIMVQALSRPITLSHRDPRGLLHVSLRNPFCLPGQPWRWRWLHVFRVPGNVELEVDARCSGRCGVRKSG
jgi:dolichyl-phosphate-mannose--protein O-mannosyl transferase